ncbi:MAG: hypothetical protein SGI74_10875 [Oligoflexia bacterium]|nr:hypothetical protein [Oligoflexia bacterium]
MSQRLILCSVLLSFSLTACETAEDGNIEAARACVDNAAKSAFTNPDAASTAASGCEAKLGSVTTKEAQRVRFGIYLIVDKKLHRMAEMVDAMKTNSGGLDGMNVALSVLVVPGGATRSQSYVNAGNGSASSGIKKVASLINMATNLNDCSTFGAGATGVQTAVAACAGTNPALVATMARDLKSSACASPSDNTSTDANNPCVKAKAFTDNCAGGQTDAAIATCLSNYLATPH